MKDNENKSDLSQALEQQLYTYFSLYRAKPEFKSTLRKHLIFQSSQQSISESETSKRKLLAYLHIRPEYKWIGAFLLFILILLSLFAIRPVRASIENTLGIGYLEGVGLVKVRETYILNGPIYSIEPDQTIGIDRVVADPTKTQVWYHSTGVIYTPEDTNGEFIAYLDMNGQKLPLISYGWDNSKQKGIYVFRSLGTTMPMSFILHISPEWTIPIRLVPMDQMSDSQSMTIYPDICQTNVGIELCLRALFSDLAGYHLWLSASSGNPIFYLQTLETHNPLTGGDAILIDSSGHQLTKIYPSQLPIPTEVAPVGSSDFPKEVSTTLSFERSTNDNRSFYLLVAGLTGKTSVNESILCELGKDPQIGDRFTCEKSINIAGELIRFHDGEITQNSDGIHLTLRSDPIQASNGLLLTGVDFENLNLVASSLLGSGFDVSTKQLEIWSVVSSLNVESKFAVRITAADLTILEPFQLTWTLNP